jgi:hypothetical protein
MATSLGEAVLELTADGSRLKSDIAAARGEAMGAMDGIVGGLSAVGGMAVHALAGAVVAGIGVLSLGLYKSVEAAMDAQAVQAQLAAVIKSTGGAAGWSAEQANNLAESLMQVTGVDDETIVSAQSLLLTFTKIGGEIMPQATEAALDMAQTFGMDVSSAAVMLGKALNDPVEGVGALRRVGVSLTAEQEEQIKRFVELGDVASAQKVILSELATETGGAARAFGQTFAGQLAIAKASIGNIFEEVGMKLLPVLNDLLQKYIVPLIPKIAELATAFADRLAKAIPVVVDWLSRAADWLKNNQGVIVAVLAAIGAAIAAFVYTTVIPAAVAAITAMAPILLVMAAIAAVAYLVYQAWTNNWGGIQEKTAAVWAWLQPIFAQVATWLMTNIPIALQTLQNIWSAIWGGVQAVVSAVLPIVMGIVRAFQSALQGDWYVFGANLRQAWDAAWKLLAQIVSDAWTGIKASISTIINKTIDFFRNTDWRELGKNIIDGLINGIRNGMGAFAEALRAVVQAGIDALRGFLGMHSPSEFFQREIAGNIMQGWVDGIMMRTPQLEAAMSMSANQMSMAAGASLRTIEGGGNIINFHYSPTISTADRYEAERVLKPFFEQYIRGREKR